MEVFPDPGPDETRDEYYRRQIRGTRNFLRSESFDSRIERFLEEEVPFDNRPDFRVFYGGLDTHVEHHLFPRPASQSPTEIAPQVKEIALRHGLPYYETPIGETASTLFKAVTGLSIPVGEFEKSRPLSLLRRPAALTRRLKAGLSYRTLPEAPYWRRPAGTACRSGHLDATTRQRFGIVDPIGEAERLGRGVLGTGAFLSLRVDVGRDALIRQYSLLHDSEGSDTMDICVKHVEGGRVSNLLNDVEPGSYLTVLKPPVSSGASPWPRFRVARSSLPAASESPDPEPVEGTGAVGERRRAVLLYFNHDSDSVLFEREIRELAAAGGISAHVFTGCRPTPELIAKPRWPCRPRDVRLRTAGTGRRRPRIHSRYETRRRNASHRVLRRALAGPAGRRRPPLQ